MEILGGNEERPSCYHVLEIHRKVLLSMVGNGKPKLLTIAMKMSNGGGVTSLMGLGKKESPNLPSQRGGKHEGMHHIRFRKVKNTSIPIPCCEF